MNREESIKKIRDTILEKAEKGLVVTSGWDGLSEIPVSEIVKQPAEGILYDLNRDHATVLTFIEDPKWVNDFAVGMVITELKRQLDEANFILEGLRK